MTAHESWIDKLSDYLDDELPAEDRAAVETHVAGCAECARTLADLKRVIAAAATLPPAPPRVELWDGITERIEPRSFGRFANRQRRISFTLPQLAAASVLLATLSGAAGALLLGNLPAGRLRPAGGTDADAARVEGGGADGARSGVSFPPTPDFSVVPAVEYADAQYDAAVADLERALQSGQGRLDPATIAVVEENLAIIDRAISEARNALRADPSDGYLSGHLMEARRRKLDLLRRAAELAEAN